MIAIVLIALAAGCASALMFASIISGALISLLLFYLAPLPLMVAALGWGPLARDDRRHRRRVRPRRDLRPALLHRLCHHRRAAGLVARPSRAAGTAGGRCRAAGNGAAPAAPQLEWYPVGRILLWIAGFAALTTIAALLTLGTDADDHHRRAAARPAADPRAARCGTVAGDIERWVDALVIDRAGGGRDRRHDDADAQSLARRARSPRRRAGCTGPGPT